MFSAHVLVQCTEFFSGTDTFGQSIIDEILEPMSGQLCALIEMVEKQAEYIREIDLHLAETQSMTGGAA
jgi:hypothetical protein